MAFSELAGHGINPDIASDAPPSCAYTKVYAYSSSVLQYEGWAKTGTVAPDTAAAVWTIRKYNYTGADLTSTTWADGDTLEDNIWDNRASLTYR